MSPNSFAVRILLLSTAKTGGGAAHACLRLFESLLALGVDVRLLTMEGGAAQERYEALERSPLMRLRYRAAKAAERAQILWHSGGRKKHLWRLSTASYGVDIGRHPWVQWAQVLHLHWVSQGFVSLRSLEALASLGKPIVWTLHDLWAVTGGCHLPYIFAPRGAQLCQRLTQGCGACPLLGSSRRQDLTARLYKEKTFLASAPFHYIAVSRAARDVARLSPLFATLPIEVIPPPMPQTHRGREPKMPSWYKAERTYLLFAAARLDDAVKGEELLRAVCAELRRLAPERASRLTLLLVGEHKGGYRAERYAIDSIYIGLVRDAEAMGLLYSVASLTLSTSLFETFGQTLTEALGGGCPVVGFASGGPEDIIRMGENGYLVPSYDVAAYARAVLSALEDVAQGRLGADECRASVQQCSPKEVARQHLDLYSRLSSIQDDFSS